MVNDFILHMWDSAMNEHRRAVLNLVERANTTKLLDLGCGGGEFTIELGERIGVVEAFGVELSQDAARRAEEKGIGIFRSDLNERFPIERDVFDVVVSIQVIEHLHNTDNFIKECYRVLRSGGYAIISTPNLAGFHNIVSLIFGCQPFTAQVSDELYVGNFLNPKKAKRCHPECGRGHLRIFTRRALKELLEYHGFKVEKIVGVGYFPPAMNRLFAHIFPAYGVHLVAKARKI